MCILVWMKITQNRPDQNIILFSSFCFEHFMYIFQILCSRQSEVLKQWDVQCQSSIDWRFLYCTINIWWQRSWSGQVTKLWCDQRTTCCWATSPITKIRKEGTAGDAWCLWEQWQHCQGFVKAALTRRAQGHTPRSRACHSTPDSIIGAMGSQLARWIMEYFNHKAASLQTHRISPCKLANRNVRGELSFTNPYLGSKQC